MFKIYASRSQTKTMGLFDPIGDPFGGPAYGEKNDPITAGVMVGGTLIGSAIQGNAAQKAAQTQADANARAQEQLLATGKEAAQQYTPYTDLGKTALKDIGANMPYFERQFTNQDLNANLAPNYAFQLEQGQMGNKAAANATGGLVGGNALQGLNTFNQNFAQNAFQQAFNNYQNKQTNIFNRLSNIAGIGMQGATGSANAMFGTGTDVAQLTQGIGQAQAAGQVGSANAYGNAANQISSYAMLPYLSSLGKGNTGIGGDYGTLTNPMYYPG